MKINIAQSMIKFDCVKSHVKNRIVDTVTCIRGAKLPHYAKFPCNFARVPHSKP